MNKRQKKKLYKIIWGHTPNFLKKLNSLCLQFALGVELLDKFHNNRVRNLKAGGIVPSNKLSDDIDKPKPIDKILSWRESRY